MKKRVFKVLNVILIVVLIGVVVYIKTTRKLKRTGVIKDDNTEQVQYILDANKEKEKREYELAQEKEQLKRDSILQKQREELENKRKQTEEIIKALNKEIEEKNN